MLVTCDVAGYCEADYDISQFRPYMTAHLQEHRDENRFTQLRRGTFEALVLQACHHGAV